MAQQLRACTVFSENPGPIPNTHTRRLTTACYSSSRDLILSSSLPSYYTHMHKPYLDLTHMYTFKLKKQKKNVLRVN